jgi:hypothetical protein
MKCESIVTRVSHEVRGRTRKDSFFLIECDPLEPFVFEILGECYVDPESMRNLEDWLAEEPESYQLMVSLDYKYARVIKPYKEDFLFAPNETVLPMLPNTVIGPPKEKLIPALRRELANKPVERLRYGLKMTGTQLSKLVDFSGWTVYEFDALTFLENNVPGNAKDVTLVWNYIANENPQENMPDVIKDLHERISDGWRKDEEWFWPEGLTFQELNLRRERARIHFERLMDCEAGYFLRDVERNREVGQYLKEITDLSELLELHVLTYERLGRPKVTHVPSCSENDWFEADKNVLWTNRSTGHHSPFLVCCGTANDHYVEEVLRQRKQRQPKWDDLNNELFRRSGELLSRSERLYAASRPVEPVYLDEEDMLP